MSSTLLAHLLRCSLFSRHIRRIVMLQAHHGSYWVQKCKPLTTNKFALGKQMPKCPAMIRSSLHLYHVTDRRGGEVKTRTREVKTRTRGFALPLWFWMFKVDIWLCTFSSSQYGSVKAIHEENMVTAHRPNNSTVTLWGKVYHSVFACASYSIPSLLMYIRQRET